MTCSSHPDQAHRDALRNLIMVEMTSALVDVGDEYRGPGGVRYSLVDEPPLPERRRRYAERRELRQRRTGSREVLRFEDLPLGLPGSRRAIVRWNDGTESAALVFYADEVLFCEGDLVGKTVEQIRSLQFRRDREWLQS